MLEYFIRRYAVSSAVVIAIAMTCYLAYVKGDITLVKSILLTLFASLTTLSFFRLSQILDKDHLGVQRSSPSIDGSISGWRLTKSFSHLLITCVFATITLIVYIEKPRPIVSATSAAPTKKDQTALTTVLKFIRYQSEENQ